MNFKNLLVSTICIFFFCISLTQAQNERARWSYKEVVTYRVHPMPTERLVNDAAIYSAIRRSFDRWEEVLGIRFVRIESQADINLGFYSKDAAPFDEAFDGNIWEGGGVLGRATIAGSTIAFDDDELWKTQKLSNGFETVVADAVGGITEAANLDVVATHEIGHSLGLVHSSNPGDVMYGGGARVYELSEFDKSRARSLMTGQGDWNSPSSWGVESFKWHKAPDALKQVSIGDDEKVWGVNAQNQIYRWNGSGWDRISGYLKHVSVGAGKSIWGVNAKDEIYRWNGSSWDRVNGYLKQISVGSDRSVWGVNAKDAIYRWNGSSWDQISGQLKQICVASSKHIWGVNAAGTVYYRNIKTNRWVSVPGILAKWVSVNDSGKVWAVDFNNNIYRKEGDQWKQISGYLKQLSVGPDDEIWGVNQSNSIYTSNGRRLN